MTITQLEYVVAVATYKSFVAAAEKCFVTQPTLSMQILKLEQELNVRIFDRSKHPIVPTDIGVKIIKQAEISLSNVNKIYEIIQQSQGSIEGTFKMAVIPTIAPYILPRLLETHAQLHPELKIEVSEMQTDDIIEKLKKNEIDCALVSTPLDDNSIKEYPLFYEPLVAYYGKNDPVLKKRMITPDDIKMEDIWLLNEGNCLRNQVMNLCSKHLQTLQNDKPYRYESSNVETLKRMVDRNGGLTILPELATFEFREEDMEQIRYFENPQPAREVSLITNKLFVRISVLETLQVEILNIVPESMRILKKDRKLMRIQAAKF